MTTDLYRPFFQATRDVFQLMLDLSGISDKPAENFSCDGGLSISIGVVGDLVGEVVYEFPRETSLRMVNIMTNMEFDTVDDFVTSAISEIANIISGNVLTLLAGKDLKCDILPPELHGPDSKKEYALQTSRCIITPAGDVCLDVRLNPSK